jgi:hypothetical protein
MRWRDAITPTTRASRRRWVLFYPLVLIVAAAEAGWNDELGLTDRWGPSLVSVVLLFVIFGLLRRSTRRLAAMDHPDLDERDQLARAEAFRLSYPLLLAVLLASGAALVFLLPEVTRSTPTVSTEGWFLRGNALMGVGVWITLWWVFLPTAVLAWREPDAIDHGSGEEVRDVALLVTFVAAMALELTTGAGLLLLIPALCLVAVWVRWRAGQEPVGGAIGRTGAILAGFGLGIPVLALFGTLEISTGTWIGSAVAFASGSAIVFMRRRLAGPA